MLISPNECERDVAPGADGWWLFFPDPTSPYPIAYFVPDTPETDVEHGAPDRHIVPTVMPDQVPPSWQPEQAANNPWLQAVERSRAAAAARLSTQSDRNLAGDGNEP